ncbi:MAG: hypothetical protein MUO63_15125 [Desulfobulbaceae bacterium]|nr:hypothetical protein [Desulfobulbaceae bacterium]
MEKSYNQSPQVALVLALIVSCLVSIQLLTAWRESGTWYFPFLAVFSIVVLIACARPLIENRKITVGEGYVVILQRFCKPVRLDISENLFQIVVKDDAIRSLRFKSGKKFIQISPMGYKDGNEISEKILSDLKKNRIVVEMISS